VTHFVVLGHKCLFFLSSYRKEHPEKKKEADYDEDDKWVRTGTPGPAS
jgi:hypothetical protein